MGRLTHTKTQFRLKHKNGKYIWVCAVGYLNSKDKLFCGFHIDINDLMSTQEILNVKSRTAEMGEMIENIIHQWRQPLSAISANASGLKLEKDFELLDDEKFEDYCDSILNTTNYLSHTLDDFREYFKEDREITTFNLNEIIKKVLTLTSSRNIKYDIKIVNKVESIEITGLQNEFVQIILNLINNAIDASIETDVDERLIIISTFNDGKSLSVKDNAGGIKEEILPKIFDKKFTTKKHKKGTGLGLYMSKHMFEDHFNGILRVENKTFEHEGKTYRGAEFILEFPLYKNFL